MGVILMVAVVVILAAVIGAFVLGLGGEQQTTPQASFTYDASTGALTMSSGDAIDGANLYYTVDGADRTNVGGDEVTAGTTIATVNNVQNSIKVIYDDGNGNTAVLTSINVGGGGGGTDE
ncbi:MAG TPA: type IV pilin N-terminal domain-containing protein [Halococcus sp.]|nr:type IV pilin N-terminal domain-containing protein [Halococcus sp.]